MVDEPTPQRNEQEPIPTERMGIASEFLVFLREHKAYWLAPILVVMLLLAFLVIAGGTSAAPFIYTLF
jgi:hypothetical protein